MSNLLPQHHKAALKRMYLLRLTTVFLFLLAALIVIHSVLLIPSYAFLQVRVTNQTTEKEFLDRTLTISGSDEVEERLEVLSDNIALLETLNASPSLVGGIETVLSVSRTNIAIISISYDPKDADTHIVVQGIAVDRDSLRGFQERLESQEVIENASFPIGDLSRERDLPFTISIRLVS